MEQDATWWLESPGGLGLAGSGIGATLRDYGRFGLFVQQEGKIEGQRIVPEGWFREAGSAHVIGSKSSTMVIYGGTAMLRPGSWFVPLELIAGALRIES
jgi:CubicO group peptidase (beta-lactamase class C family)